MRILITGKNGFIARSFAHFMEEVKNHAIYTSPARSTRSVVEAAHKITSISLRDDSWRNGSFCGYDAIIHTAGLVHKKETKDNEHDYFTINRDLTFDVAKKAKADGVGQFVFLSSISVYGLIKGHIKTDTPTDPTSNYGRSKLAAESLIAGLADDSFKVAILRLPMVYGQNIMGEPAPGNYAKLCKVVKHAPFFPDYDNARDLIHIKILCISIEGILEKGWDGILFPRDPDPISTRDLALAIAEDQGKNLPLTKILNWPISLLMPIGIVSKLFGDLIIGD